MGVNLLFDYKYYELMNPVLDAIKELGGSASNSEIHDKVSELLNLTDDQINDIHKGSSTKLVYRLAWARSYLKKAGFIDNSERGIWSLTDNAAEIKSIDPEMVKRTVRKMGKSSEVNTINEEELLVETDDPELNELVWQDEVLEVIKSISPDKFERLCKRLLRELGFINVIVTGRPNDQGIDGKGILKIGGVISFHTAFQAKRYAGTVSSSVIRDFRGAMQGRADKGLVITTGTFSKEAKAEAQRDGATPIDLIDGNELAEKIKELRLGVKIEMVEKVTINKEWFNVL